jgi:hypothetical protein
MKDHGLLQFQKKIVNLKIMWIQAILTSDDLKMLLIKKCGMLLR